MLVLGLGMMFSVVPFVLFEILCIYVLFVVTCRVMKCN